MLDQRKATIYLAEDLGIALKASEDFAQLKTAVISFIAVMDGLERGI